METVREDGKIMYVPKEIWANKLSQGMYGMQTGTNNQVYYMSKGIFYRKLPKQERNKGESHPQFINAYDFVENRDEGTSKYKYYITDKYGIQEDNYNEFQSIDDIINIL